MSSKKKKKPCTYVYVDKLLSYVDRMPYFSSLNLNISFGSHPFDWWKETGGKREKVSQSGPFFSPVFALSNMKTFLKIIKKCDDELVVKTFSQQDWQKHIMRELNKECGVLRSCLWLLPHLYPETPGCQSCWAPHPPMAPDLSPYVHHWSCCSLLHLWSCLQCVQIICRYWTADGHMGVQYSLTTNSHNKGQTWKQHWFVEHAQYSEEWQ